MSARLTFAIAFYLTLPVLLSSCRDDVADVAAGGPNASPAAGNTAAQTAAAPQPLAISGRVMMEDGSPPRGDVQDIAISISGVSDAAVNVQYAPAVQEDGSYSQKVSPGQYIFNTSRIIVRANGAEFPLPLEPVGRLWNKDRDAADGIVQNFVWKVTGPTPYGQSQGLNPADHTHWYGMSVNLGASSYREDIKAAATPIADGTKLTFSLKPTSQSIDGRQLEPLTFERTMKNDVQFDADLNDLTPASYEMTGTATMPDGSVKPLLFQGHAEYPNYRSSVQVLLEKDNIIGGMAKPMFSFAID